MHLIQSVTHWSSEIQNGCSRSEEQADRTERLRKWFPERVRYDAKKQQHDRPQGTGGLRRRRIGEESVSVL